MSKVHVNVPRFWCLCIISIKLFFYLFSYFDVLGAKMSAFKSYGGHWFPKSLHSSSCSETFLVLEIYSKKAAFSLLFLKCSWILNFCQSLVRKDSGKPGKPLTDNCFLFLFFTHGTPLINTDLKKNYEQ